ncbi:MAG: DedA family protein [Rhodoluna sp.]|nr:DedA family protein [Rhodoluna sp.]
MTEFISWLFNAVHSIEPLMRDLIAFGAIFSETSLFLGIIVPGDSIVLITSSSLQNIPDFIGLVLFVILGSLAGESVGFWLGRVFGKRIRASWLGQKIGEKNWELGDSFVHKRGGVAVAISRFIPVLHSLVPVIAGMSKMTYRTFIVWTVAACTLWSGVYTTLGWLAGQTWQTLANDAKWGGIIFAALLVVAIVLGHLVKATVEKAAEKIAKESLEEN